MDFPIPTDWNLWGTTVRVRLIQLADLDDHARYDWGLFDPQESTLWIHSGLNPALQRLVLLHELLHWAYHRFGYDEVPEPAIDAYAFLILKLTDENPAWVETVRNPQHPLPETFSVLSVPFTLRRFPPHDAQHYQSKLDLMRGHLMLAQTIGPEEARFILARYLLHAGATLIGQAPITEPEPWLRIPAQLWLTLLRPTEV